VGEPLSVTERWPDKPSSGKTCRCRPDAEPQVALEKMILILPLNWVVLQNLKLKKALLLASLADVGTNTKNLMSFIRR